VLNLVFGLSCALLFTGHAGAQVAPQFTLSSTNPAARPGYTSTPLVNITYGGNTPNFGYQSEEWCASETDPIPSASCTYYSAPAQFTLSSGNTVHTLYIQVQYDNNGKITYGPVGSATITLDNQPPSVNVTSPVGLPNTLGQQQMLSSENQFSTGTVTTTVAGEPVEIQLAGCEANGTCTPSSTDVYPTCFYNPQSVSVPCAWTYPTAQPPGLNAAYVQLTAISAAGLSTTTLAPRAASFFTVFDYGSLPLESSGYQLACGPTNCPTLAPVTNQGVQEPERRQPIAGQHHV
jgi:hypothetical protein